MKLSTSLLAGALALALAGPVLAQSAQYRIETTTSIPKQSYEFTYSISRSFALVDDGQGSWGVASEGYAKPDGGGQAFAKAYGYSDGDYANDPDNPYDENNFFAGYSSVTKLASFDYTFLISGDVDGIDIPTFVSTTGYAVSNGPSPATEGSYAEAGLVFREANSQLMILSEYAYSGPPTDVRTEFASQTLVNLRRGVLYGVYGFARAHNVGFSGAEAYVDPVFTIDPDWIADNTDYAADLRFIGIPSASTMTIPEPATWAMMILGFGASGAMLRRRRSMVAV